MNNRKIRFIDLFAGIGGIRLGFEQAAKSLNINTECVFTSEIKPSAIDILNQNFKNDKIFGDIRDVKTNNIPDFDFLLGGFPCQAFSAAGKRLGFLDTRGTLFFEIERILKEKKPYGFILENVEGLVNHDKIDKYSLTGRTLSTILNNLKELGYNVDWKVLNSKYFGLPQERKRVYIVGSKGDVPDIHNFIKKEKKLKEILETGLPTESTPFINKLLTHFNINELYGKSIKDKRGGEQNIHSWDIELKGKVCERQKDLLNKLFKERRKKKWALELGIDWMDGIPLTISQIKTFVSNEKLDEDLEYLSQKGYLRKEHPKRLVSDINLLGEEKKYRRQDPNLPIGYNIVAGKLSYEVSKILDPNDIAPTLVAMDMQKLFVVDGDGLRKLTLREGLRLFGYPENFSFNITINEGYDLLGNTVTVPVIEEVSKRFLKTLMYQSQYLSINSSKKNNEAVLC